MLAAGALRHRVTLQKPVYSQDPKTGDAVPAWQDVAKLWANVAPLSAREFEAANADQSKVEARITIRYRADVDNTHRFVFRGMTYNIEGVLPDNQSGLEYLTVIVSEGVRWNPGSVTG